MDAQAALLAEVRAAIVRLAELAYPGQPVTGTTFRERLALVEEDIPAEARVSDWKAPIPLGRLIRYRNVAREFALTVEQILATGA